MLNTPATHSELPGDRDDAEAAGEKHGDPLILRLDLGRRGTHLEKSHELFWKKGNEGDGYRSIPPTPRDGVRVDEQPPTRLHI